MTLFQDVWMTRQGCLGLFIGLLHKQKDVISGVDLSIFFLLFVFPQ